jgi:hypothetical protein
MKRVFLLRCVVAIAPIVQLVSAKAADLDQPMPPIPYLTPSFSWTGFYIGPNIGAGWENFNITDTLSGLSFGSNTRSACSRCRGLLRWRRDQQQHRGCR